MADHTLAELADRSGIPARTIRYYIGQGLIPAPGRKGAGTRYPGSTLDRLQLIRRFREDHLPLAEIRRRIVVLSDAEVASIVGEDVPAPRALPAGIGRYDASSAGRYLVADRAPLRLMYDPRAAAGIPREEIGERTTWERVVLGPEIELHVRGPLAGRRRRIVERIIASAARIQSGEEP